MDSLVFYVVMGLTYLFSLVVRKRLNLTYSKYSRVPNRAGFSGEHVARDILDSNGLRDVELELAQGTLTDHYDPRTRVIRLSLGNARGASVAAMAVAAHEAAHALQDADDYAPLEIRTSILPLMQAGARLGIPLAIVGSFFGSQPMFLLGTLAYLGSIAFYFVTLPVELDASRRALVQLKKLGITHDAEEEREAKETLRAAAMTYVAGAASAAGFVLLIGLDFFRAIGRRPRVRGV
jgi:Zn-dependent membrane protease YugP